MIETIKVMDCATRVKDALLVICMHTDKASAHADIAREGWRQVGEAMLEQRKLIDSDRDFGAWVKQNRFDTGLLADSATRSNAMWLATHWAEVEGVRVNPESPDGGLDGRLKHCHPNHLRQQCRALGYAWAGAKQKKLKLATKRGWTEAVEKEMGSMPKGLSKRTLRTEKRELLEKELGKPIPSLVNEEEAKEIAGAVRRLQQQNEAKLKLVIPEVKPEPKVEVKPEIAPQVMWDQVTVEAAALPKTSKERFDALVKKAKDALLAQYHVELKQHQQNMSAKVSEQVEAERTKYNGLAEQARDKQHVLDTRMKTLDAWMTKDEFKKVLSCLHPDKHPESERRKFDEAFTIFNRLQEHMSPSKRELKAHGWF